MGGRPAAQGDWLFPYGEGKRQMVARRPRRAAFLLARRRLRWHRERHYRHQLPRELLLVAARKGRPGVWRILGTCLLAGRPRLLQGQGAPSLRHLQLRERQPSTQVRHRMEGKVHRPRPSPPLRLGTQHDSELELVRHLLARPYALHPMPRHVRHAAPKGLEGLVGRAARSVQP